MQRVVVEHQESLHLGDEPERDGVGDAGMTPPDPVRVFLLGVLRVVQQHVGPLGDRVARDPVGGHCFQVDPQGGLVVGDVGEHPPPVLHPVSERRPRVLHELATDPSGAQLPFVLRNVVEHHVGRDLVDVHREQWRGEVGGHAVPERVPWRCRPPEVDLAVRVPDRGEEPEALDVIEVEMRQQDVDAGGIVAAQANPEVPDPRARVDHQ